MQSTGALVPGRRSPPGRPTIAAGSPAHRLLHGRPRSRHRERRHHVHRLGDRVQRARARRRARRSANAQPARDVGAVWRAASSARPAAPRGRSPRPRRRGRRGSRARSGRCRARRRTRAAQRTCSVGAQHRASARSTSAGEVAARARARAAVDRSRRRPAARRRTRAASRASGSGCRAGPARRRGATCRPARAARPADARRPGRRSRRRLAPARSGRPRRRPARVAPEPNTREVLGDLALEPVEQVPAPLDDGAQRAVPGHRRAPAAGEQPEPVGQPVGDLGDGDSTRSRAAASSMASGRPSSRRTICTTRADGVVVEVDAGRRRPGPGRASSATAGRLGVSRLGSVDRRPRRGHRQRGQRVDRLAVDAERLAAGREHPHARAAAQQLGRPASAAASTTCSQLSTHQQALGVGQRVEHPLTRPRGAARLAGPSAGPAAARRARRGRRAPPAQVESGSVTGASSANHTPSGAAAARTAASTAATSLASRVLPEPPAPTTVTSRPAPAGRPQPAPGRRRRRARRSW